MRNVLFLVSLYFFAFGRLASASGDCIPRLQDGLTGNWLDLLVEFERSKGCISIRSAENGEVLFEIPGVVNSRIITKTYGDSLLAVRYIYFHQPVIRKEKTILFHYGCGQLRPVAAWVSGDYLFYQRKPHTFRNRYHVSIIAADMSSYLVVEESYRSPALVRWCKTHFIPYSVSNGVFHQSQYKPRGQDKKDQWFARPTISFRYHQYVWQDKWYHLNANKLKGHEFLNPSVMVKVPRLTN